MRSAQWPEANRNDYLTEYRYDELNREVKRIDAHRKEFITQYDEVGNVSFTIDEELRESEYRYDQLNRLEKVIDDEGEEVNYDYDAAGNLIEFTDELDRTTTYRYDALDRQTYIEPPLGAAFATTISYSDEPYRLKVVTTDPRLLSTTQYFDARDCAPRTGIANRLVQTTDHNGGKRSYSYDGNDNLTAQTDELDRTTQYFYDKLNRQVGFIDPLTHLNSHGHTLTTRYDAVGNVLEEIDAGDWRSQWPPGQSRNDLRLQPQPGLVRKGHRP